MNKKKLSRTERDLRKAMLELMDTNSYSDITVTMLSEQAEVNRKTFYAYYSNKDELLYAMLYEMFEELFECFMYSKPIPTDILDEDLLETDARRFLEKVEQLGPRITTLVTNETSSVALETSDHVVMNLGKEIHILEDAPGRIPQKFYIEVLRNFFMSLIDAWLESEERNIEEGVYIVTKILKQNQANVFRYVRPTLKSEKKGKAISKLK